MKLDVCASVLSRDTKEYVFVEKIEKSKNKQTVPMDQHSTHSRPPDSLLLLLLPVLLLLLCGTVRGRFYYTRLVMAIGNARSFLRTCQFVLALSFLSWH